MIKFLLLLFPIFISGQYHFEKFKSLKCDSIKLNLIQNNNDLEYSTKYNSFFNDKSNLEVMIFGNSDEFEKSFLQLKTNNTIVKYFEAIPVQGIDMFYIADYNGDGKKDIKIVCFYMGCGLASLNARVVYFIQKMNNEFIKISFDDKIGENQTERDINSDGNFEIITKTLQEHKNHNYWLFNVYNFCKDNLVCVNEKLNYPIMVQYLNRDNYKISKKVTRQQMKNYHIKKPKGFLIQK